MISISSNNAISMTRGDTLILTVNIKKDGADYTPDPGDTIRFAMSTKYLSQKNYELIMVKDIPVDTMVLRIEPEDTKELPYGTYNYDIQLTDQYGIVDTFISSKITLTVEVE